MPRVTCHRSCVTCHMSHITFFSLPFTDKVVKLVGWGSVINRAYPVYFLSIQCTNRSLVTTVAWNDSHENKIVRRPSLVTLAETVWLYVLKIAFPRPPYIGMHLPVKGAPMSWVGPLVLSHYTLAANCYIRLENLAWSSGTRLDSLAWYNSSVSAESVDLWRLVSSLEQKI